MGNKFIRTTSLCLLFISLVLFFSSYHSFHILQQALVRKPLRERRDLLHEHFQEVEGEFVIAKSMISSDTEDIQVFLDESVKGNFLSDKWTAMAGVFFTPYV